MPSPDIAPALRLADYFAPLPNGKLQEAGAMLRALADEVERQRKVIRSMEEEGSALHASNKRWGLTQRRRDPAALAEIDNWH